MSAEFISFDEKLIKSGLFPLEASGIQTLQINLGHLCNLECRHCHVGAGPLSTEIMSRDIMDECLKALSSSDIKVVDLTGGAPEMNPHYWWFIGQCSNLGLHVMTRTNLTILQTPSYADLHEFWAEKKVEVIASLPYYLEDITDRQRGTGVFQKSIDALRKLNSIGYGIDGSGLILNIVYNPGGAFLPPAQASIEKDFHKELSKRNEIQFNRLFTITNMPISRFLAYLIDSGNYERYMEKLISAYNPSSAANVMCKNMISLSWDGGLFDCDFNQMLGLKVNHGAPSHIREFDPVPLSNRQIVTGIHCYGCTAGGGSSCGGEIA